MNMRKDFKEEMDDTPTKLILVGGNGDDPNWLLRFPVGTIFTCRHVVIQGQRQNINEFEIVGKENNGDVKLYSELADVKLWVDSLEFSTAHTLRNVLCKPDDSERSS